MTHPAHCRGCRGSGYQPGEPITQTVQGRPHVYTTVKPCEHDHWNDDNGWDPYRDKALGESDPKAVDARERNYAIGRHELWLLSGGQLGEQHPNDPDRKETA